LSYNVAGLPEGISSSHPERFTELISPLLNGYDLVLVQESWQTPDPNPFAPTRVYHEILAAGADHPFKSVPAVQPLGMDPRRPEALLGDGLNYFSRFPFAPVIRQAWEGCDISAADCLAFKGFSVARMTFADSVAIDVYNLHMEAGGTPHDEELRNDGVTQLLAFMAEFSADQAVIVGGDFNLHTDEEPDASQFERLLAEGGLTDVCAFLGCAEPGRIDKFLFRPSSRIDLEATSWRFETDVFVSSDGEPLSDHDPLAVRFVWSVSP
jgi:endonuclease/exonuclease/phosphatase family metal-dependent hydrolase